MKRELKRREITEIADAVARGAAMMFYVKLYEMAEEMKTMKEAIVDAIREETHRAIRKALRQR
jgi:hypothetical protein